MIRFIISLAFVAAAVCSTLISVGAEPPIEQLRELQQKAEKLVAAGDDRDLAIKVVGEIIDRCAVDKDAQDSGNAFAADDPMRIRFLFFAAKLDAESLNHPSRALRTYQIIATDANEDSIERIHAEAILLPFRKSFENEAIGLLSKSLQLTDQHKQLREQCQNIVFNRIIQNYASGEFAPQQLVKELDRIQEKMIQQGVPVGIAKLTLFAQALSPTRPSGDEAQESLLAELKEVVMNDQVTDFRRAQFWNLYAALHLKRRHYADAFDACREFERLAQQLGRDFEYQAVMARDQGAYIALLMGDYETARRVLDQSREAHLVPNQVNPLGKLRTATHWRLNLAKALEGSNDFGAARVLLEEASESLEKYRDKMPELAAQVDNNLGLNHYLAGRFELAAEVMGRSRRVYEEIGGLDERIGEVNLNAGWIALGNEDTTAAEKHFATAQEIFAENLSEDHPRIAEALTCQARVAAIQGNAKNGLRWIRQAEQLDYRRVCRDLAGTDSQRDRIAMVQEARVHPESIAWPGTLDTFLELAPELDIPATVQYDVVLRWKGLIQRFDRSRDALTVSDAQQEDEIKARLREAYFRKVSFSNRPAIRQREDEINGYVTRIRELQRARRAQRLSEIDAKPSTIADVVAKLQPGDLFLDVFQIRTFRPPTEQGPFGSGAQYLAFALRQDGTVDRLALGSADELDDLILRCSETIIEYQQELSDAELEEHQRRLDSVLTELAQLVQKPILATGATIQRLLVRADAMTHLIPWSALPGIGGHKYWVEDIGLQFCNGAGPSVDQRAREQSKLLVVGGVEFGELREKFPPLEGSVNEKEEVLRLFGSRFDAEQATPLSGRSANEATLLNEMPGKDFIHLATHGFYRKGDETDVFGVTGVTTLLRTGLIVAPTDDGDRLHDQRLTAAEIADLDLSQTRLVVLSACESGLGRTLAGQGVQGMLGSFHSAGASRVVGTLWIVDDAATVQMAEHFYHHLWEQNLSPSKALRAAQLDMIHTPSSHANAARLSHPYAWAAFVCSVK